METIRQNMKSCKEESHKKRCAQIVSAPVLVLPKESCNESQDYLNNLGKFIF